MALCFSSFQKLYDEAHLIPATFTGIQASRAELHSSQQSWSVLKQAPRVEAAKQRSVGSVTQHAKGL